MAAKQMRCVVILASMARIFAEYLFQPTLLLPAQCGIRDVLTRQAQQSSARECAVRALLQALLPSEQEPACSKRIDKACDAVMMVVHELLLGEQQAEFRGRLQGVAEEACEIWRDVCHLTDAVKPSFKLSFFDDWNWNWLEIQVDQPVIIEQTQSAQAERDEALFVIFPRLYVTYEEGQTPETHGVVFMKAQAQSAREEVEKLSTSPELEKRTSVRNRLPRIRRGSMGSRSTQTAQVGQPFLGSES